MSEYNYARLYHIQDSSAPVFMHHEFKDNPFYWGPTLIYVTDHASPVFCNNVFYRLGRCISSIFHYAAIHSTNNIFYQNGMVYSSRYGTTSYDSRHNTFYQSFISWSQIAPGHGELCQTNLNGDSCDIYYNLFQYPMFTDTANNDFHLTESSPCIDAGDPTYPFDPDSTIADMGAYYFDQLSIGMRDNTPIVIPGYNISIVPNPTNGNATVILQKEEHLSWNNTRIRLFDLNGESLAVEEIEYLLPNDNHYSMDLKELCKMSLITGTYLLSLEINGSILISTKLIIK